LKLWPSALPWPNPVMLLIIKPTSGQNRPRL
jgi:hypothetical protein